MLYINAQHVDLTNDGEDYKFAKIVKDFNKTILDFRHKYGENVLFKSIYQPRVDKVTGVRRPHKVITIPYKSNVPTRSSGNQKWVYSPEGAVIKDGVATPTPDIAYVLKFGSVTLSLDDDAEFIYYLTKTSKYLRNKIYIYDENEKQDELADQRAKEVRLSEAIYSEASPLNDESTLKEVARKWGISGMEKMRTSTIKNTLFNRVTDAENQKLAGRTNDGIDTFLIDINRGAALTIGADIQLAKEKGLLSFSRDSNEWLLIVEKDEKPWSIMRVDGIDTPRATEVLAEFLQRNEKYAEKLSLIVSGNAKIEKGKIIKGEPENASDDIAALNAENIMEETNYSLLQKAFNHYNLGKFIGVSRETLKKGLLEFFEAQTQEVN